MYTSKICDRYTNFFKSSPRNHQEIPPAPLVLEGDPTTLFISAGMQPLVPFLKGKKKHPLGKRLVNVQPSFRTEDIEEVGDLRHMTFFKMLGNWSLGDYFKKEQLAWIWEFLTKELGLPKKRLFITLFSGEDGIPRDEESYSVWKQLGVPESRIFWYGAEKNWWSRSGTPAQMIEGDIGGPDSEIFFDFGESRGFHKTLPGSCHPNCECGRFLEIANSVFIEYQKTNNKLEKLPFKSVDFGAGLERLSAATQDQPDIFKIDVFQPLIKAVEEEFGLEYGREEKSDKNIRIIADHLRASKHLILAGVLPANKLHGYVLRRLIRRSVFRLHLLGRRESFSQSFLAKALKDEGSISRVFAQETERFNKTLNRGLRKLEAMIVEGKKIDGKAAFDLYQTDGFPLELTLEILKERGIVFSDADKASFRQEFEKHKELSRQVSAGIFKGGLSGQEDATVKLHTATHLLHQALRNVLGEHVKQMGSNITPQRLRFDFSHPKKLTKQELEEVENIVNEKIKEALPVTFYDTTPQQAREENILGSFWSKYGQKVRVYKIGNFSKEICGGPHVQNTAQIGHVTIIKEESAGSGVRRIYAVLGEVQK